jgi:hypothetical protein
VRQRLAGVVVDRASRLLFVVLLLGFAAWRLIRYVKLGMGKRPVGIASGAGMIVQATTPAADAAQTAPAPNPASRLTRLGGMLIAVAFWVLANLALALVLFGLPFLRDLPPIVLLVAIVLANFYLIPRARRLANGWGSPHQ